MLQRYCWTTDESWPPDYITINHKSLAIDLYAFFPEKRNFLLDLWRFTVKLKLFLLRVSLTFLPRAFSKETPNKEIRGDDAVTGYIGAKRIAFQRGSH
jgi:hypothetical protein